MKRFKFFILVLFLLLVFSPALSAQDGSSTTVEGAKEYEDGEFPAWSEDVYRFEVIAVGSLPLTILFAELGYSVYLASQGDNRAFTGTDFLLDSEQAIVLSAAGAASLTIALLDYLLGLGE
jgi:hypothetical protein